MCCFEQRKGVRFSQKKKKKKSHLSFSEAALCNPAQNGFITADYREATSKRADHQSLKNSMQLVCNSMQSMQLCCLVMTEENTEEPSVECCVTVLSGSGEVEDIMFTDCSIKFNK